MSYEKELKVAMDLAKKAGESILPFFKQIKNYKIKKDGSPLTSADLISNKIIVEGIKSSFPGDGIVSEEQEILDGKRVWYVDPLDGTQSFLLSSPEFSIEIGFCEYGRPVLGVVFLPVTGEMYYGIKDKGSFILDTKTGIINKIKISSDDSQELSSPISYNLPLEQKKVLESLGIKNFTEIGSTGLKILHTLEKSNIFITTKNGFKLWDICAPHAIVVSAGGIFEFVDGRNIIYGYDTEIKKDFIVSTSKKYVERIRSELKKISHDY